MEPGSTASIERRGLWAAAAVAAVWVYLAAALPITAQEAYAFGHFVRPPVRDLLGAFDPANGVLNTLLMKRTVGVLRLSAFSLRAPGLLGLALYLWAVAGMLARTPRAGWMAIPPAGAAYLMLEYSTPGSGVDVGLALWVCAAYWAMDYLKQNQSDGLVKLNLAGLCLGLSVAANCCFLVPSLALAVAMGLAIRRFTPWMERIVVTAVVTGFLLLVLPFSHASAGQLARLTLPPRLSVERTPEDLAGLVAMLRRESKGKTVRIAASGDLVPVMEFYQARYREGGWRILTFPGQADYYVVDLRVAGIPGRTLYRGRTVALAQ